MIAMWMLRVLAATALIAVAAHFADEAARGLARPRRWVWLGAFVLAALVPWVEGLLPAFSLADMLLDRLMPTAVGEAQAIDADAARFAIAAGPGPQQTLVDVALIGGWMLATVVMVLLFVRALWRLRVARWRGRPGYIDGVEVIRSDSFGPATVGIVRPSILLPRWVDELSQAERSLIVSHEREHAMARDPMLLAAAALIVVAAPWCLPLWWMHRRLRDAAETDCDARVLRNGADRLTYGRALLCAAARRCGPSVRFAAPLHGGLDVTRLERRILMINRRRPKHPILRSVPLITVAAVVAAVACDAASDTVATPQQSQVRQPPSERAFDSSAQRDTVVYVPPGQAQIELRKSVHHSRTTPRIEIRDTVVEIHAEREGTFNATSEDDPVFYIDGERVDNGGTAVSELDPAAIDRIEVYKGDLLALYPPDHAGGVVHIFTKDR